METKTVSTVGFYSAVCLTLLTLGTFVIAVLTPPLGGPYCTGGCYSYPYAGIVARFPRDYIWMYPAILLSLVYYVLMVSIHYVAPSDRKLFSHIGLSFALVSTATFVLDYFLQLSVIQPSLVQGEMDGIALLSQFNAHGIFIVLEEIGFFMMSLSMLCMAPAFVGATKEEKAIRWLFRSCFALTVIAFILYSAFYGIEREYRFEVAAISINWLTLIVSGILLGLVFRRALVESSRSQKTHLSTRKVMRSGAS